MELHSSDHQIQGVLQSEEYGVCCFFPDHVKKFLDSYFCDNWFEIYDLYEKWSSEHSKTNGPKGLETQQSQGLGFWSEETQKVAHEKSHQTQREQGIGIWDPEVRKKAEEARKKMDWKEVKTGAKQRWMCLVTKRVSNAMGIAKIQKKRGIDPKLRVRLE